MDPHDKRESEISLGWRPVQNRIGSSGGIKRPARQINPTLYFP